MRKRNKVILALLAVLIVGATLMLSLMPKLRVGMSLEQVQQEIGVDHPIHESGLAYRDEPTAEQIQNDIVYMIELNRYGLTLFFNRNKELIEIRHLWEFGWSDTERNQ